MLYYNCLWISIYKIAFTNFIVLEASDVDHVLANCEDFNQYHPVQGERQFKDSTENSPLHTGPLTFSRSSQNPQKKSQIIAAVQNHFSISSLNGQNPSLNDCNESEIKPPRIGKNRKILQNILGVTYFMVKSKIKGNPKLCK